MNRNAMLLVIGLLVAAVCVVGYLYYQESQSGVEIQIGSGGVKIDGK